MMVGLVGATNVILQTANTQNLDDAYIYLPSGSENYGASGSILSYYETTAGYDFLIKFNISIIPDNATIQSASLNWYLYDVDISSLNEGWNISSHMIWKNQSNWNEETVKGNGYPSYNPLFSDTKTFIGSSERYTWHYWNVTSILEDFVGETNVSIYMRGHNEIGSITDSDSIIFRSKETGDSTLRPFLNITYTIDEEPPSNCWTQESWGIFIPNGCVYSLAQGVSS